MSTEPAHAREDAEAEWYASAFDTLYPLVYAHRSVESAAREAAFAVRQLELHQCEIILDLCCGGGRHLFHLAQHCYELVGLDYSKDLLGLAQRDLPDHVDLVRGDMRALPFEGCFDAVVNFFTSFGYFEGDEENRAVIETVGRSLKPGGKFFMDYLNPAHVRATLEPESVREQDGLRIEERRWINESTARVNKATEIFESDERKSSVRESVKLYEPEAMAGFFDEAGFEVVTVFGDYEGEPVAKGPSAHDLRGGKAVAHGQPGLGLRRLPGRARGILRAGPARHTRGTQRRGLGPRIGGNSQRLSGGAAYAEADHGRAAVRADRTTAGHLHGSALQRVQGHHGDSTRGAVC